MKFIFISDLLIEKRLGVDERIIINKSSIIAFESTIYFYKKKDNLSKNFIEVYGPGLIVIEMSKAKSSNKNTANFNKLFINMFFIFVIVILIVMSTLVEIDVIKNNFIFDKQEK